LGRLHLAPRFRQRLAFPPPGFGEPFWVDDTSFDISRHVVALSDDDEPLSLASFGSLTDAAFSVPLDRKRPLWQMVLAPRLEDGRVGMVAKLHHAMADGLEARREQDRKSTRLNSSHRTISYAVFCLKKKTKIKKKIM